MHANKLNGRREHALPLCCLECKQVWMVPVWFRLRRAIAIQTTSGVSWGQRLLLTGGSEVADQRLKAQEFNKMDSGLPVLGSCSAREQL